MINKINSVAFTGRKDVVYGLKKASSLAKEYEELRSTVQGPRPMYSNSEKMVSVKSKMEAYLDMAVHDDTFENVVLRLPKEDLDGLKNTLRSKVINGLFHSPFTIFSKTLENSLKEHLKNEKTISEFIASLK